MRYPPVGTQNDSLSLSLSLSLLFPLHSTLRLTSLGYPGWFWECPTGATCHYRHALPPGYVLKSQLAEEAKAKEEEEQDIGEIIEQEVRRDSNQQAM